MEEEAPSSTPTTSLTPTPARTPSPPVWSPPHSSGTKRARPRMGTQVRRQTSRYYSVLTTASQRPTIKRPPRVVGADQLFLLWGRSIDGRPVEGLTTVSLPDFSLTIQIGIQIRPHLIPKPPDPRRSSLKDTLWHLFDNRISVQDRAEQEERTWWIASQSGWRTSWPNASGSQQTRHRQCIRARRSLPNLHNPTLPQPQRC